MKRLILLTSSFLILAACAPKPEDVQFKTPKTQFGPQRQDVDLGLSKGLVTAYLQWSEDVSASVFYRLNDNLLTLSKKNAWEQDSLRRWVQFWWATRPVQSRAFAEGSYAGLLVKTSEESARPLLEEALKGLEQSREIIVAKLMRSRVRITESAGLEVSIRRALEFVRDFETSIPELKLEPTLAGILTEEVSKERQRLEAKADGVIKDLYRTRQLSLLIEKIQKIAAEEGFNLDAENTRLMKEAHALGRQIDEVRDSQDAMSLIVALWKRLTPQERKDAFLEASETLYNHMAKQDEEGLRCLSDRECNGVMKTLIKVGISQYGIDQLRRDINRKACAAALLTVSTALHPMVRDLGPFMAQLIGNRIDENLNELRPIARDFNGTLKSRLSDWAEKSLPSGPLRLEKTQASRIQSRMRDGRLHVQFSAAESSNLETEGSALGLGARLASEGWLGESANRSWFLTQFDEVAKDFQEPQALPARSHAEILRGYSLLARPLREFEKSVFDDLFGFATAQQLFPTFQVEALKQSLFPKDALFALSLEKLSKHLEIVTAQRTPVFLVDVENRVTWADQFNFSAVSASTAGATPIMAGIVDRRSGERANQVRSEDVARYLLGLCEFLRTSANLEQTKSVYLRQKRNGSVPLELLQENLPKLKMLVLALSNYLSNQLRREDGLIHHALSLPDQKPVTDKVYLLDQALALRALVEASEILRSGTSQIELYRWEAMDLVAAMNKELFVTELGFYEAELSSGKRPALPVLVETLRGLGSIQPHLPAARRSQLQVIEEAWLKKVGELF